MKNKKNIHNFNSLIVDELSNNDDLLGTFILTIIEDFHETEDLATFLTSLKQVVESKGGMRKFSEKTGINRQHLYKIFSKDGNPTFSNLMKVLKSLNLFINIKSKYSQYSINSEECDDIHSIATPIIISTYDRGNILIETECKLGIQNHSFEELEVYSV